LPPALFAQNCSDTSETKFAHEYFLKSKLFSKEVKLDSTEYYLKKAAAIYKDMKDWPNYVKCLIEESYLATKKGQNVNSWFHIQNALKLGLEKLSANDTLVAECYLWIGQFHTYMKNADQAIQFYQKALKIFEEKFGSNHHRVADAYRLIGQTYKAVAKFSEALENYNRALAIKQNIYGRNHPGLNNELLEFASLYFWLGDYDQAQEFCQKSYSILSSPAWDHITVITPAFTNLSVTFI
jgi:tetratricopeptide (TPR) repeat protein